jgi:hypothetical protein
MANLEDENESLPSHSALSAAYLTHVVFDDLENYRYFYSSLSHLVFSFMSGGTTAVVNLDTYIFSSIAGTMDSIRLVLRNGRLNDAYSLLRKYCDSVFINAYEMQFLNEHVKMLLEVDIKDFLNNQVNNWLHGRELLPGFGKLKQYLNQSSELTDYTALILVDDRYTKIRDRANNNAHYNYFRYVMYNDNEVYLDSREKLLEQYSMDLKDLFVLHFIYIFAINQHYMMSEDYRDYIEMGETAPKNSQYWVAPFIQNIFDTTIKLHRPDLAAVLRSKIMMELT